MLKKSRVQCLLCNFLSNEGKIKEALDFLRKIESNYSIDDLYRYTYGGDNVKISFDGVRVNLIRNDFTNNFQLIINSISNEQLKSLAYLSFIYNLNKNYDYNKIEKYITESLKHIFNLEDLDKGKTTNSQEYL